MCDRYCVTEAQAALIQRYGAEPIYLPDETYLLPELFPGEARGSIQRR